MYFLNNLQSYWLKSLHPIVWWILRAICWSFLTRAGSLSSSMNLQHNTLVCRFIILAGIKIAHILLIIPILVSKPGCCLRILLKLVVVASKLVCVSPDVLPGHLVQCTYLSTYHRLKLLATVVVFLPEWCYQYLTSDTYIRQGCPTYIYAKLFQTQRLKLCIYHSLTNTYPAK